MTIAEFFVKIGIKGDDKTKKGLGSINKEMQSMGSNALAVKAAVVGAIYALERMMSSSAQTGTNLKNFSMLTGISAQNLQKWQYAARQAGVDGEELTGSLKSVQNSMANMLMGKGAPEGLAMVANKVGFDQKRARDTLYVMGQLQKFAQTVPEDIGNQMIKSFGISDNMIAAMRRNAFNDKNFKNAPVYSDKDINALDKVNVMMSNLEEKVKRAFGQFTIKNGAQIVSDITMMTTAVIGLADSLMTLSKRFKIFEGIGDIMKGLAMYADVLSGKNKTLDSSWGGLYDAAKGFMIDRQEKYDANVNRIKPENFIGPQLPGAIQQQRQQQNINIQNNNNFQHEGKDAPRTGADIGKATREAFRQFQAQTQVS